jgi:hypothetical protein
LPIAFAENLGLPIAFAENLGKQLAERFAALWDFLNYLTFSEFSANYHVEKSPKVANS